MPTLPPPIEPETSFPDRVTEAVETVRTSLSRPTTVPTWIVAGLMLVIVLLARRR